METYIWRYTLAYLHLEREGEIHLERETLQLCIVRSRFGTSPFERCRLHHRSQWHEVPPTLSASSPSLTRRCSPSTRARRSSSRRPSCSFAAGGQAVVMRGQHSGTRAGARPRPRRGPTITIAPRGSCASPGCCDSGVVRAESACCGKKHTERE